MTFWGHGSDFFGSFFWTVRVFPQKSGTPRRVLLGETWRRVLLGERLFMNAFKWTVVVATLLAWSNVLNVGLFVGADEIVPPLRHDPTFSSAARDQLIVALMADPQLHMNPDSLQHAGTAMNDLAELPHDFLVVLGDLVQNKPEYFADYKRLILEPSTKPVYSIAGNAELGAGLEAYQKCAGLPLYYVICRRGIRFIFTSVTKVTGRTHSCDLGDVQLAWLKKELASDTKSTTIIAFHAPVFETTWRSEDRESLPFPGSMYLKESVEVRALLAKNPNVKLYVHGHLHHAYGVRDDFGRGEYCLDDGVLHISVARRPITEEAVCCLSAPTRLLPKYAIIPVDVAQ